MRSIVLVLFVLNVSCVGGSNPPFPQVPLIPTVKDKEMSDIIKKALKSKHPLVIEAWTQAKSFYKANGLELEYMLSRIAQKARKADKEKVKQQILAALDKDEKALVAFDEVLKPLVPDLTVLWQLKSHKMKEGVRWARSFIDQHFDTIWTGKTPPGYAIKVETYVVFGDPDTIYGDGKGMALKTALVYTLMALYDKKTIADLSDVMAHKDPHWLDKSAFVHLTPIPKDLDLEGFEQTPFVYKDPLTGDVFMTVIHNGYAFGGMNFEHRYPHQSKKFGPQDCSSWFEGLLNVDVMSTKDLWYANRYKTNKEELVVFSDPEWAQGESAQKLLHAIKPCKNRGSQKVKIGDIYFNRNFSATDQERLTGKSGHVNVVLGIRPSNGHMVTLGYNRSLEDGIDGFAIQDYPFTFDAARESYCLEKVA